MLKILRDREIWWPVVVSVPDDGGGAKSARGEIRLRYPITRKALQEFNLATDALPLVAEMVTGWRGDVFDGEDFSRENLLAALAVPSVNGAVQLAILEVANGRAAVKNSDPGPGGS